MNKSTPIITVWCPVFNHAKYIEKCLDGFVQQKTNFIYEVIVHDDASSDGTEETVRAYENKYPKLIRGIYQTENQFSKDKEHLFKTLYSEAKGKYIALCEGDDYWTDPYKLQKQVDFLEANEDFVATFHNVNVDMGDNLIKLYSDFNWNNIDLERDVYLMKDVIASPLIPTCSLIYRNELKLPKVTWSKEVASADMMLAMLITGHKKIKMLPDIMAVYRKHDKGITATHKNDFIHANRIFLYLRMMEHYNYEFKTDFIAVIKSHFKELKSLESLTKEDRKILLKLIPTLYLKKKFLK